MDENHHPLSLSLSLRLRKQRIASISLSALFEVESRLYPSVGMDNARFRLRSIFLEWAVRNTRERSNMDSIGLTAEPRS